jgi:uncharacterized coiled-coil DUF342 family protein
MDTPKKIPLEALVKWLNKKLSTAKQERNDMANKLAGLRQRYENQSRELAKRDQRIEALVKEAEQLRNDAKNSEWYRSLNKQLCERSEQVRTLKRNYNTVLCELNKLREKYGEQ